MKNFIPTWMLLWGSSLLLSSCFTTPPEKYFDQAVLNSNMLNGFATEEPLRELASPSVKLNPANNQAVAMSRMEMINAKIEWVTSTLEKINQLKETPDTKDMLQASKALYEFVLPVYKTDYVQLARLYDEGASEKMILAKATAIHDAAFARYDQLYTVLIGHGKLYAQRHSIKVNWNM